MMSQMISPMAMLYPGQARPKLPTAQTAREGARRAARDEPPPVLDAYGAVIAGQSLPAPGLGSLHTIRPWIAGLTGVLAVM